MRSEAKRKNSTSDCRTSGFHSGDPDLVRCDRAFRGTGDRTAALDGTLVDHAPGQSGSYSITSVYCQRTVWNRSDGSGRKELFL